MTRYSVCTRVREHNDDTTHIDCSSKIGKYAWFFLSITCTTAGGCYVYVSFVREGKVQASHVKVKKGVVGEAVEHLTGMMLLEQTNKIVLKWLMCCLEVLPPSGKFWYNEPWTWTWALEYRCSRRTVLDCDGDEE